MENRKTIDEWVLYSKVLALEVMKITDSIPFGSANNEIIKQITRLCNSVAANFRATKRAKSIADFLNKYKIVEEEADETIYFLEIIGERRSELKNSTQKLIVEYNNLLSIIVASINTIKRKAKSSVQLNS